MMTSGRDRPAFTLRLLALVALVSLASASCSTNLNETTSLEAITCGSGFGASSSAELGISTQRPIWSKGWDQAPSSPVGAWVIAPDETRWISAKAPIAVLPGIGGTVNVKSPDSARLIVATSETWGTADDDLLLMRTKEVELPVCVAVDAYPSLLLVPEPACVRLDISSTVGDPYEAVVPMGISSCS